MLPDADRAANIAALDCVSQFVQADHRRDLIRYRVRLHNEIVIRSENGVIVQGADEAAVVAVRDWAAAPDSKTLVDDIGVASGMVTMSYRVTAGVLPGSEGQPRDLAGHSIFEVQDDKIIRIWHHLRAVDV
ncbi:MAG: nuclear transport factor 2 family protein [Acidimicrobiales bacterium]